MEYAVPFYYTTISEMCHFFSYNDALYRHIKTKKQHVQSRTFKQAVTMCYSSLNNNAVMLFYIVVTDSQHLVASSPCDCRSLV